MFIYLPILIILFGTFGLLFLISLDEFAWYRKWSRKRQFKAMKKY
jgi:hypothetical protein